MSRRNSLLALALGVAAVAVAAGWSLSERRSDQVEMKRRVEALTGGQIDRGERAFASYGCGGCHQVNGVPQAEGLVGPPLDGLGSRAIIAGKLANRPDNLQRWIIDPQRVTPDTAMPDLGVTREDARNIAAFLYSRH